MVGPGTVEGAEMTGEVEEAGEGGVDGRSAAIGEGKSGEVSSARTKAGLGLPADGAEMGSWQPIARREPYNLWLCSDHEQKAQEDGRAVYAVC